ncbi:hypothetical protein [Methanosarcina sp.]|uniref:hypothetical protein n=1 Tax=Methanosarcina sp. TaxID=2213 RepID=UPI003BB65F44
MKQELDVIKRLLCVYLGTILPTYNSRMYPFKAFISLLQRNPVITGIFYANKMLCKLL